MKTSHKGRKGHQGQSLSDRASKAIMSPPGSDAPQGEIYFVASLQQFSSEAFSLAELMTTKGETFIGQRLNRYGRYLGKAARLIEDLAKEHLRRSRRPIETRKSKIKNGRKGK